MTEVSRRLREMATSGRTAFVPDCHDVLAALAAQAHSFDGIYVGSLGLSNAGFGIPDQSLLGIQQLIDQARLVAAAVDLPVCLDLEDGGGNAVTTHRNVALAEAAGVSAIQIEDHVPGKNYAGRTGALHPVEMAGEKIRAASDARRDPDTVIIGRTDALLVGRSEQEALDRAGAYVAAGAEMVTVSLLPIDRVPHFASTLGVPLANFVAGETAADLEAAGLAVALYPGHSLVAYHGALTAWLRRLRAEGESFPREEMSGAVAGVDQLVSGPEGSALAPRYRVTPG